MFGRPCVRKSSCSEGFRFLPGKPSWQSAHRAHHRGHQKRGRDHAKDANLDQGLRPGNRFGPVGHSGLRVLRSRRWWRRGRLVGIHGRRHQGISRSASTGLIAHHDHSERARTHVEEAARASQPVAGKRKRPVTLWPMIPSRRSFDSASSRFLADATRRAETACFPTRRRQGHR